MKSWSYSVKEVADILGVDDYLVYELLKKNQMEAVIVDYWKHIPKESFQNWYKSQSRYRTKEDREKDALLENATITMPEMQKRVFKNSWKVRIGISWTHRMIMKNLHRNRILPWLISGGRNYHEPEYEEAMEI